MQYQTKDAAADALRKLPFEKSLGDFVDIDFYQSKESRMQYMETMSNPIQKVQNGLLQTQLNFNVPSFKNHKNKSPSQKTKSSASPNKAPVAKPAYQNRGESRSKSNNHKG